MSTYPLEDESFVHSLSGCGIHVAGTVAVKAI